MFGIWEARKISSHFRHQDVQNMLTHPIDLFTTFHLLLKRVQMPLNFSFQALDGAILCLNEGKQFSQQKAMMLSYLSGECGYHLLPARMDTGVHQARQALWVAFSVTERLQDRSS